MTLEPLFLGKDGKFREQAGLADARLAAQDDRLAVTGLATGLDDPGELA